MDRTLLKQAISDLFYSTPDYVHMVGHGYKVTNGQITNQKAIIFSVIEKKPLDQVPANELLPFSVNIGGETVLTDVIQLEPATALAPYRSNCYSAKDSSSAPNRARHRPLLSGISLARVGLTAGTLGLIVKDKDDGTIVGLTNNHVIINYPFYTADLVAANPVTNNCGVKVLQPGPYDGGLDPADRVGFVKRYDPIWEYKSSSTPKNYVDAAICSLNDLDLASIKQIGLDNATFLPFATTAEIDNLLENANDLFHSGRSTGAVGFPGCPLVVFQEDVVSQVSGYNKQGSATIAYFDDTLAFEYKTPGQVNALVGGDSGSVTIANIGGVNKVVGLNFAGPSSTAYGLMCRIDRVATALNIEAWDPAVSPLKYSYISDWSFIVKDGPSSSKVIIENGKKYWQVGAQKDSGGGIDTIYVTYTPSTGTTTTVPPGPTTTSIPGTTTTKIPTTPPPTPGTCDIYIKCAFVFDKTTSSISVYLVYDQDYSYTDTYLQLEFYDATGTVIQGYTTFKKVNSYYDVLKILDTDPLLSVAISDICAVSARLYQPNPCIPSTSFDGSDSGTDIADNCIKTTLGDMTGYTVEAIYVDISDFSDCVPPQTGGSIAVADRIKNSEDYINLPVLDNDNHIAAPGDVAGCGVAVKSPCGSGHLCNRAQFDIFLSANGNPDTKVLEANLNNSGPVDGFGNTNPDNGPSSIFGGTWDPLSDGIGLNVYDRYSSSIITKDQNDAIFAGLPPATGPGDPAYSVTVKIVANPINTNPHLDITWVRIKDTCGRIVYSCCIGEGVLDPDPCCEKGGGPVFPPCPDWTGPPVPGCLPPTTTTTTTTTTPAPTTPIPSGAILSSIVNHFSKNGIIDLLKINNVQFNISGDCIVYNSIDKTKLYSILSKNNININVQSYEFNNKDQQWISTNYVPDNFILTCSDGDIIFIDRTDGGDSNNA